MLKKFCAITALVTVVAACSQDNSESTATDKGALESAAAESISIGRVRAHIEYLADDLFEGRDAGTKEYDLAAKYVASQFRLMGLKPAGDDNGYLQPIRFMTSRLKEGSAEVAVLAGGDPERLTFLEDFVSGNSYGATSTSVTAPLVFVGFGVTAPDQQYDDFEGINVAGKIAVMLSGAPAHFPTDRRAFYSSGTGKKEQLTKRGAIGIISVRTPVDEKRTAWERITQSVGSKGMRWIGPDNTPWNGFVNIRGSVLLSGPGAEKLFRNAPQTLENVFAKAEAGEENSFDLGYSAMLTHDSEQAYVDSSNVIGLLEGSDPELKSEYVVFTAHLDHIGIRGSKTDDKIHNGAYDNATGIAIMLETARAIADMPSPPRRSILFVAVTAEEKGLLGSEYFARNPTVPIDGIVANINIDMPVFDFVTSDLIAFGSEHSSLSQVIAEAAAAEGMALAPDPWPEEVIFIRSDQYRFIQRGIPAVALWPGLTPADPEIDGPAVRGEFMSKHYHRPSDDLSLPFNEIAAGKFARTNFQIGLGLANADERPTWNVDDFFGDKFGRDHVAAESGSGSDPAVQE